MIFSKLFTLSKEIHISTNSIPQNSTINSFSHTKNILPLSSKSLSSSSKSISSNTPSTPISSTPKTPSFPIKKSTFADFCEYYWQQNPDNNKTTACYRKNRVKDTKTYVKPYFKNQKLNEISPQNIKEFLQNLFTQETRYYKLAQQKNHTYTKNQFLSIGTIRIIRTTVLQPILYAYEQSSNRKYLSSSKFKIQDFILAGQLRQSKSRQGYFKGMVAPRDIFTQKELNALENSEWSDSRAYMMFLVARYTGMRNGELRGLKIKSIKPECIEIQNSYNNTDGLKCTKNGISRRFPIFPELYQALQNYIHALPEENMKSSESFVFPSFKKKHIPVGSSFANNALDIQMKKINIPKERISGSVTSSRTFHSLRHCMDTYLTTNTNLGITSVAHLMGHSPSMVQHYSDHFNEDVYAQAVSKTAKSSLWPTKNLAPNNILIEELCNIYAKLDFLVQKYQIKQV